jgi:hypothetical protein
LNELMTSAMRRIAGARFRVWSEERASVPPLPYQWPNGPSR